MPDQTRPVAGCSTEALALSCPAKAGRASSCRGVSSAAALGVTTGEYSSSVRTYLLNFFFPFSFDLPFFIYAATPAELLICVMEGNPHEHVVQQLPSHLPFSVFRACHPTLHPATIIRGFLFPTQSFKAGGACRQILTALTRSGNQWSRYTAIATSLCR